MNKRVLSLVLAGIMFGGAVLPVYAGEKKQNKSMYQRVKKAVNKTVAPENIVKVVGYAFVAAAAAYGMYKLRELDRKSAKRYRKELTERGVLYADHYPGDELKSLVDLVQQGSSVQPITGKDNSLEGIKVTGGLFYKHLKEGSDNVVTDKYMYTLKIPVTLAKKNATLPKGPCIQF